GVVVDAVCLVQLGRFRFPSICAVKHGPEIEHLELTAVARYARLPDEHAPGGRELYRDGDAYWRGAQRGQAQRRTGEVPAALEEPRSRAAPGRRSSRSPRSCTRSSSALLRRYRRVQR